MAPRYKNSQFSPSFLGRGGLAVLGLASLAFRPCSAFPLLPAAPSLNPNPSASSLRSLRLGLLFRSASPSCAALVPPSCLVRDFAASLLGGPRLVRQRSGRPVRGSSAVTVSLPSLSRCSLPSVAGLTHKPPARIQPLHAVSPQRACLARVRPPAIRCSVLQCSVPDKTLYLSKSINALQPMLINEKEQKAFRKFLGDRIKHHLTLLDSEEGKRNNLHITQAIQSDAIKLFESFKGSIPNEWEWRDLPA